MKLSFLLEAVLPKCKEDFFFKCTLCNVFKLEFLLPKNPFLKTYLSGTESRVQHLSLEHLRMVMRGGFAAVCTSDDSRNLSRERFITKETLPSHQV